MKRVLLLATLAIILASFLPKNVSARSGCCSHHGGVCGCGCCDGSSLSSTCAPYYPMCTNKNTVNIKKENNNVFNSFVLIGGVGIAVYLVSKLKKQ
jgi:hypothetical protein